MLLFNSNMSQWSYPDFGEFLPHKTYNCLFIENSILYSDWNCMFDVLRVFLCIFELQCLNAFTCHTETTDSI